MAAPRGGQRRLVDDVGEVRADHARRRRREPVEIDVGGERHRAGVHLEDLAPPHRVGRLHGHPPVEAPRAQQRRIEHLGPVGRGDHDHPDRGVEAVHLGEDLVERLLALVVPAAEAADRAGAGAADRVELVDEDDRRRRLLGLLEEIAHPGGANADEQLDELRGGDREERHLRLPGERPGQQRLAGPGRAGQQHAARDPATQAPVLLGIFEEVDELGQLLLGLVDPGDVLEVDGLLGGLDPLCARAPEGPDPAAMPPAARRIIHTNSNTISSAGPKLNSNVTNTDVPVDGEVALITTPLDCSSASSALLLANSGISVTNTLPGSRAVRG